MITQHLITNALIYIPAFHDMNGRYAWQCYNHCFRRRYGVVAIVRDWTSVLHLLDKGSASVVVMAPTAMDEEPTERLPRRVGEQTRELSSYVRAARLAAKCRTPTVAEPTRVIEWTRSEVAAVIDGNGPIPAGLDPEAIAAARRIARRLTDGNQTRV